MFITIMNQLFYVSDIHGVVWLIKCHCNYGTGESLRRKGYN